MIVFALDTTLASCSAALLDAGTGRLCAAEQTLMDKGHAEAIAPMVARVLAAGGAKPGDLARIAVTTGPGTFTGLRIGLSLAHGMGVATGCPVTGIDTLTATAAPLLASVADLMVVHRAGATGRFYAARFVQGALSGPLLFEDAEAIMAMAGAARPALIGTGADSLLAHAPASFARLTGHDLPVAADFVMLAATRPPSDDFPQPIYLREPDAKPQAAFSAETIRLAVPADTSALARLHQICFDDGWNTESLGTTLASPGVIALVAERDGAIRAFLLLRAIAGEAEVLTLCTAPHWRRRALGGKLVDAAGEMLRIQKVSTWHLEVAADNAAARALYESHGFRETGRRKGYYARGSAPACDAILMTRIP